MCKILQDSARIVQEKDISRARAIKSCMQDSCTILHDLASSFLLGILAIQTRAQRRRQQQLERADADATAQSGAVITQLHGDSAPLPADRPCREHRDHDSAGRAQKTAAPAVNQPTAQTGAVISGDSAPLPADRPGREHTDHKSAGRAQNTATPAVNQSPDGDIQQHTVATQSDLAEKEDQQEKDGGETIIITDPFTRAELIRLQNEDTELQELFTAASDPDSDGSR